MSLHSVKLNGVITLPVYCLVLIDSDRDSQPLNNLSWLPWLTRSLTSHGRRSVLAAMSSEGKGQKGCC